MMKKRKRQKSIKFTEKTDPENDENAIDFRWSDIRGEEEKDISKTNLIESLQNKLMKKIFIKE